jgi:septal ring factor EnvC (AmiA/AmiB activator)
MVQTQPPQNDNGWTQYQQLVINELQRLSTTHTSSMEHLGKIDIMITRLESDVKQVTRDIVNIAADLSAHIKFTDTSLNTHEAESIEQRAELNKIKWKIGAFSAGLSAVVAWLAQYIPGSILK